MSVMHELRLSHLFSNIDFEKDLRCFNTLKPTLWFKSYSLNLEQHSKIKKKIFEKRVKKVHFNSASSIKSYF